MKRTHFTTLGEEVRFDDNGDPIAFYDLMNWQKDLDGSLQLVRVGFYDASLEDDKDLVIDEPVIVAQRRKGVCHPTHHPILLALFVFSSTLPSSYDRTK